jgi:hypothetical protein
MNLSPEQIAALTRTPESEVMVRKEGTNYPDFTQDRWCKDKIRVFLTTIYEAKYRYYSAPRESCPRRISDERICEMSGLVISECLEFKKRYRTFFIFATDPVQEDDHNAMQELLSHLLNYVY